MVCLRGDHQNCSYKSKTSGSVFPGRKKRRTYNFRIPKTTVYVLISTATILYYCYCVHVYSSNLQKIPASFLDQQRQKRVFVCITGQASRLVLQNQIDTLLIPMQQQGYEPEVALALTETTYTTNAVNGKSVNKQTFQNARQHLVDSANNSTFPCLSQKPIVVEEKPKVNEQYLKQMDKKEESKEWQHHRVENHARQYQTLAQCYQYLAKHPPEYYEFGIRIREDVSFEEPLNLQYILPQLSRTKRTILTSDCRTHGGMNDRLAIFSIDGAKDYFTLPHQKFLDENYSIDPSVKNPETYLLSTYTTNSLNVKFTNKLRGLIKYVTNDKGQFVPARKENIRHCPRGVKHILNMAYKYATFAET